VAFPWRHRSGGTQTLKRTAAAAWSRADVPSKDKGRQVKEGETDEHGQSGNRQPVGLAV
jgi:hypothetical protein